MSGKRGREAGRAICADESGFRQQFANLIKVGNEMLAFEAYRTLILRMSRGVIMGSYVPPKVGERRRAAFPGVWGGGWRFLGFIN